MNYLIKLCDRLGILRSEIDYHVLRASMVLIFLFFGYQKWFRVRSAGARSVYQQPTTHRLDVSSLRN